VVSLCKLSNKIYIRRIKTSAATNVAFSTMGVGMVTVGAPVCNNLHPQGSEKMFFRRNIQGKCVSATRGHEVHPPATARVIL